MNQKNRLLAEVVKYLDVIAIHVPSKHYDTLAELRFKIKKNLGLLDDQRT
jgi:hypothetical protein